MAADWEAIAQRIKGLVSMSDRAKLASAAARLDVDLEDLEGAIKAESPTAILRVVAAMVRVYGLDPSWLITGRYDAVTHRMGTRRDPAAVEELLRQLVGNSPADGEGGAKELG